MSQCTELDPIVGCHTDADGNRVNVVIHYEYGKNAAGVAVLAGTRITDVLGVPVAAATGENTTAGACPVAQPDVEWETRCDTLADGTVVPFMCQVVTSFDAAGAVIVPSATANYALDKVTPYTPAGDVGTCPACSPATAEGLLTAWGE